MFGKKKEVVEYNGLPVLLSRREAFDSFTGLITSRFLAYRVGDEWKGLVGYGQFREELDLVNKKLELILAEMNLTYQPETEKKEPARLVKRPELAITPCGDSWGVAFMPSGGGGWQSTPDTKPKKKRGRPKKK